MLDGLISRVKTVPSEVFDFPTVKEVDFEIRFSPMFSMEARIGDFQELIIEKFPESAQILRQQLMFSDTGINQKIMPVSEINPDSTTKIWEFKSKEGITIHVQPNRLAITSNIHKTYNNDGADLKFREVIEYVLSRFFKIIKIPIIKRIGLRYIDNCPVPTKNNENMNSLYDLTLPLNRFPVDEVRGYHVVVKTNRKKHKIIYQEALKHENDDESQPYVLVLDFDGFELNIASQDYLQVTDELHEIITEEYFRTIKEPIKMMMRTGKLQ